MEVKNRDKKSHLKRRLKIFFLALSYHNSNQRGKYLDQMKEKLKKVEQDNIQLSQELEFFKQAEKLQVLLRQKERKSSANEGDQSNNPRASRKHSRCE